MQTSGRFSRFRQPDQRAVVPEQPDQLRKRAERRQQVPRSDFHPVLDPCQLFGAPQCHGGQFRQQAAEGQQAARQRLATRLQHVGQRYGPFKAEFARPRPAQGRQHAAHAERGTQVVSQRPDVETSRRPYAQSGGLTVKRHQVQLAHRGGHGLGQGDHAVLGLAGDVVRPRAIDVLGRERRRGLFERAAKPAERLLDLLARGTLVRGRDDSAHGVVGVGGASEPNRRLVVLVARRQELGQPGGAADHQRQYAGGHGVERPGVANARHAQRASRQRDHVMRGGALRLVNDEHAIGKRQGGGHFVKICL